LGLKEPRIRRGSDFHVKGHFCGGHTCRPMCRRNCNVPCACCLECACSAHEADECIRHGKARVAKTAMRPLANYFRQLLCLIVFVSIISCYYINPICLRPHTYRHLHTRRSLNAVSRADGQGFETPDKCGKASATTANTFHQQAATKVQRRLR